MLRLILGLLLIYATNAAVAVEPDFQEYGFLFNNAKNDGGFNQSAFTGLARLYAETGLRQRERVTHNGSESEDALRTFAERGVGNIMAIGFMNEAPIAKVAPDFPKLRFTLIDGAVDLPNVRSVLFKEDEVAFLAGVAAGQATKTQKLGFVGALPIPPIRRFECGFLQGVKLAAPQAEVMRSYLGATPSAFRDLEGARATARKMIDGGADVLFAAAGLSGSGVMEVAAAAETLIIGVDINQNGVYPGKVLTSAVKRMDVAVYLAWKAAYEGRWSPGLHVLGVDQEGVGLSRDASNEEIFAPLAPKIDLALHSILSGERKLVDFAQNPDCQ